MPDYDESYPEMGRMNRIESEPLHSGGGYRMEGSTRSTPEDAYQDEVDWQKAYKKPPKSYKLPKSYYKAPRGQ